MKASFALLEITPPVILNSTTTGLQPPRNSCLLLACAGSDKGFERANLVRALLAHGADLEQEDSRHNTAYLLASAQGVSDVMEVLLCAGANKRAKNVKDKGGFQLATACSTTSKRSSELHFAPRAWTHAEVKSSRQHHGAGNARAGRHMQQHATRWTALQTPWQTGTWWEAGNGNIDQQWSSRQYSTV